MELPKEFKGEVHFYQHITFGFLLIHETRTIDESDYIYLGSKHVEVKFTTTQEDAVKKIVAGLQKEKINIQAKAQSDLNKLDEKINSLLAINYDGGE